MSNLSITSNFNNKITEFINSQEIFPLNQIKINIYWCRHGESCSNWSKNLIEKGDDYRPIGYDKIDENKEQSHIIKETLSKLETYTKTAVRTINNLSKEPPLTYMGIQQAVLLNKNYTHNKTYDKVFCSTLTRAAMTALFGFRNTKTKKIYVIPYINEKTNILGSLDKSNYPNDSQLLKKKINFIKDWIETNYMVYFDDIEAITILIEIKKYIINKNIENLKGLIPIINIFLEGKHNKLENHDIMKVINDINIFLEGKHNKLENHDIMKVINDINIFLEDIPDNENKKYINESIKKIDGLIKNKKGYILNVEILKEIEKLKTIILGFKKNKDDNNIIFIKKSLEQIDNIIKNKKGPVFNFEILMDIENNKTLTHNKTLRKPTEIIQYNPIDSYKSINDIGEPTELIQNDPIDFYKLIIKRYQYTE